MSMESIAIPAAPSTSSETPRRVRRSSAAARAARFKPEAHGFRSTLKHPQDPEEREEFDQLLAQLYDEFLPCTPAECLCLETLVLLQLRRIRLQQAFLKPAEVTSEEGLKRSTLLSRLETDTLNKLEKQTKLLRDLQSTRAERRGLALEAALVQQERRKLEQQMRKAHFSQAVRALNRELADLALAPSQAGQVQAQLLGVPEQGRGALPQLELLDEQDSATETADLLPIPEVLPGPPWDPWRGASPEQLRTWNDKVVACRKARLRTQLEQLDTEQTPCEEEPADSSDADSALPA